MRWRRTRLGPVNSGSSMPPEGVLETVTGWPSSERTGHWAISAPGSNVGWPMRARSCRPSTTRRLPRSISVRPIRRRVWAKRAAPGLNASPMPWNTPPFTWGICSSSANSTTPNAPDPRPNAGRILRIWVLHLRPGVLFVGEALVFAVASHEVEEDHQQRDRRDHDTGDEGEKSALAG